jgi:uncharacterized protein with LGFP repeats
MSFMLPLRLLGSFLAESRSFWQRAESHSGQAGQPDGGATSPYGAQPPASLPHFCGNALYHKGFAGGTVGRTFTDCFLTESINGMDAPPAQA